MGRASWSRWGRSSYERDADLLAERQALEPWVELRAPEQDAEILSVTSRTRVDEALLARAPSARLVVTTTSGYDHLDLGLLAARGVAAARLPEARRDAVVETTLALLLGGLRCITTLQAEARAGRWARGALPELGLRSVAGRRVAVVGLGVIGRKLAEVLQVLGAEVLGLDPAGLPEGVRGGELDTLLAEADALTLHCDLNPGTRGMISAERLARARPGLVLVNTARGPLVDLPAALDALRAGRLGGLGLDVFPVEPWPDLGLTRDLAGLTVTPHAAGWHVDLPARSREGLARAVAAWVEDRPVPYRIV